jgi:hypothetical protein
MLYRISPNNKNDKDTLCYAIYQISTRARKFIVTCSCASLDPWRHPRCILLETRPLSKTITFRRLNLQDINSYHNTYDAFDHTLDAGFPQRRIDRWRFPRSEDSSPSTPTGQRRNDHNTCFKREIPAKRLVAEMYHW